MLPLALLKTAQGHPVVGQIGLGLSCLCLGMRAPQCAVTVCSLAWVPTGTEHHTPVPSPQLIELKSGETYNGHLVLCDTWMNIHLREVICTSKVWKRGGGARCQRPGEQPWLPTRTRPRVQRATPLACRGPREGLACVVARAARTRSRDSARRRAMLVGGVGAMGRRGGAVAHESFPGIGHSAGRRQILAPAGGVRQG